MIKAELRGWLPLIDIYLSEAEIKNVILESERSLSKYAKPSGEAVFPTSARVISGRKDEPGKLNCNSFSLSKSSKSSIRLITSCAF